MNILELSGVNKSYGSFRAVDSLSFKMEKGTVFGLLGPNGAGKTTTIRMIMTIILPDSGDILLNGEKITMDSLNTIGYLPEERGLYPKMKVLDILMFFARLKGIDKETALKRTDYWLKRLELENWRMNKLQDLSKGMQQKIQFIATIINDPELIILDEPFTGLDPINTRTIKDIITEMKNRGKSIIFSTHIMEQVEKMCDHILLINKGRNILDGRLREVKRRFRENAFRVYLDEHGEIDFSSYGGVDHVKKKDGYLEVFLKNDEEIGEILSDIVKRHPVTRFEMYEPSLNDIFINVVEGKNE